jgi:hypothetical protein
VIVSDENTVVRATGIVKMQFILQINGDYDVYSGPDLIIGKLIKGAQYGFYTTRTGFSAGEIIAVAKKLKELNSE